MKEMHHPWNGRVQKSLVQPHPTSPSWLLKNPSGLNFPQKSSREHFHQFEGCESFLPSTLPGYQELVQEL